MGRSSDDRSQVPYPSKDRESDSLMEKPSRRAGITVTLVYKQGDWEIIKTDRRDLSCQEVKNARS